MAFPVCGECFTDCADCWGLCSCNECAGMHPHDEPSRAGRAHAEWVRRIDALGKPEVSK